MNTLFHLAFPVHDLALAKDFYQHKLGFELGRESGQAVIFKFGTHQIVAHKVEFPTPLQDGIYPRHFGLIFWNDTSSMSFWNKLEGQGFLWRFH